MTKTTQALDYDFIIRGTQEPEEPLKFTPEALVAIDARLRELGHEPRPRRVGCDYKTSSQYTILLSERQVGELIQLRRPVMPTITADWISIVR